MADQLAIGVDLGATKIAVALADRAGRILAETRLPTSPQDGPDGVMDRIAQGIQEMLVQAQGPVAGVGIGSPGRVDPDAGTVAEAANLGWDRIELVRGVEARLAAVLPIHIAKDANAEVLGEVFFGAAQGERDCIYLGIGSGLGSGIVSRGRLVIGSHHTGGEIGHLVLDPDGRACNCGQHGCAETVISGPGLVATVNELLPNWAGQTRLTTDQLSVRAILDAAQSGDPAAQAGLAEMGRWLGIALASCVALLNPAVIVIGGGAGRSVFDRVVPLARTEMARRVLPGAGDRVQIRPSRLASSALGASCLVWQAEREGLDR